MTEIGFCPAQSLHVIGPVAEIRRCYELIELRRLDAGASQHRMDLTAMVGLVVEQVEEKIVTPFNLQPRSAMHCDVLGKRVGGESIAQG